jgi:hypothetical protein
MVVADRTYAISCPSSPEYSRRAITIPMVGVPRIKRDYIWQE